MGILRSEEMCHGTLVLPVEQAHSFLDAMGHKVNVQFEDMNHTSMRRPYKNLTKCTKNAITGARTNYFANKWCLIYVVETGSTSVLCTRVCSAGYISNVHWILAYITRLKMGTTTIEGRGPAFRQTLYCGALDRSQHCTPLSKLPPNTARSKHCFDENDGDRGAKPLRCVSDRTASVGGFVKVRAAPGGDGPRVAVPRGGAHGAEPEGDEEPHRRLPRPGREDLQARHAGGRAQASHLDWFACIFPLFLIAFRAAIAERSGTEFRAVPLEGDLHFYKQNMRNGPEIRSAAFRYSRAERYEKGVILVGMLQYSQRIARPFTIPSTIRQHSVTVLNGFASFPYTGHPTIIIRCLAWLMVEMSQFVSLATVPGWLADPLTRHISASVIVVLYSEQRSLVGGRRKLGMVFTD
eukprot:gene194-biopygen229